MKITQNKLHKTKHISFGFLIEYFKYPKKIMDCPSFIFNLQINLFKLQYDFELCGKNLMI